MPTIVVRRHHNLGLAKAKHLAQSIARRLKDEHGGSFEWNGNVLLFERTGVSGLVVLTKDEVAIQVEVSFLLSPLRSRIEREIVTFCDEHLAESDGAGLGQPARRAVRRRRG